MAELKRCPECGGVDRGASCDGAEVDTRGSTFARGRDRGYHPVRPGRVRFACPAIYENGTILRGESCWNWTDIEQYGLYSVADDDYKIPEGWWENRHFTPDDVYNNPVDCVVTHWMPLPWRLVC